MKSFCYILLIAISIVRALLVNNIEEYPAPSFSVRRQIGKILEKEGLKRGAELGVQSGKFARITLESWSSCTYYLLVDIWAQQENYIDGANVAQDKQDLLVEKTSENVKKFGSKVHWCRNYTSVCVLKVADASLDYVYVDARHDYKGALEDIKSWWDKIRPGGLMCGHDFVYNSEVQLVQPNVDYSINYDGTKDEKGRAVRGAVEEWAALTRRTLSTGSSKKEYWKSWCIRR